MTVAGIAQRLGLAKSHTMKIVAKLVKAGLLHSQRGRNGGISLGKAAEEISVGDIVRVIEVEIGLVECMRSGGSSCVFLPNCKLRGFLYKAQSTFLAGLDNQSLQSVISPLPEDVAQSRP